MSKITYINEVNIFNMYDWNDINTKYINYNNWAKEWTSQKTNRDKQEFKSINPAPIYIKPSLSSYELKQLDLGLANIKAVKKGELYSAELTLKSLSEEAKPLIHYLYSLSGRSDLYHGTGKENARHCALVPLFLAAQKEYNGIPYEAWDKSDKFLPWLIGKKLYEEIVKWKDIPIADSALKVARELALTDKRGKRISPTAWPMHSILLSGIKTPAASLGRHIILQTWLANIENRNEFMILDLNNWDHMPKAFDSMPNYRPTVLVEPEEKEELPW